MLQTGAPKSWPSGITYLHNLHIPPSIGPKILHVDSTTDHGLPMIKAPPSPSPNARITPITDSTHPACGQYGLFAARTLEPGSFILLYIGALHWTSASNEESDYDLSLDRTLNLSIDAAQMGNEARFINDYRGVAERPNAEFRDCVVEFGHGRRERRIGVFVLSAGKAGKRTKGVARGQEILVSYGKGFWSERRKDTEDEGVHGSS